MVSRTVQVGVLLPVLILVSSFVARGQSQLVPLVTDKTPLALSDRFGYVFDDDINQAGDLVFIGNLNSALFLRRAGDSAATRVFQMGDEVPGFAGSRADAIQALDLNEAGLVVFKVDFALATGRMMGAILAWDGTALRAVVTGLDHVPGSTTVRFERGISLLGLDDSGAVAFAAPLVDAASPAPAQTTIFIARASGSVVRVAGLGDAAPGTGGKQYGSFSPEAFSNAGDLLFGASLTAGSSGYFVGSVSGVRKVVAQGDAWPSPLSGTFGQPGGGLLNNAGDVAFTADGAIWTASPAGSMSRIVALGDAAPAPPGAVYSTTQTGKLTTGAFNDAGMIAFTCPVTADSVTTVGLFRYRPALGVDRVALSGRRENGWIPPGAGGNPYFTDAFSAISMNTAGDVAFRVMLWDTPSGGWNRWYGIYRQHPGESLAVVAHDYQATGLAVGGAYSVAFSSVTRTLDDGRVFFFADVSGVGSTADFGEFLASPDGTAVALMTTADPLPAGSNVSLRTLRAGAAGDYVGFVALRAGGGMSVGVHQISTLTTKLQLADGEEVDPGTRIRINTRNAVFVNAHGTIAASVRVTYAGKSLNVIGMRKWDGQTFGIAEMWDRAPGTGSGPGNELIFTGVALNSSGPCLLNDADQVAFYGTATPYNMTMQFSGLWLGSPSGPPVKIATNLDTVPSGDGGYGQLNVSSAGMSLNQEGQVAFAANTNVPGGTRPAIYLWTPGVGAVEVARKGPGNSFTALSYPSLNDQGDVAFIAALSGGAPRGAVYVSQNGAAPAVVAADGGAAPGTGTGSFSIAAARPEVVINNQDDVMFRADVAGGTSDSGYFLRRGLGGDLQAVVLQGQAAPGGAGAFAAIKPGSGANVGELIQMDPAGEVAFQAPIVSGGEIVGGLWHVRTDNVLEGILARGVVAPQFGGGVAVSNTPGMAWNSAGRFPLWARVSGGTFTDGIFLFVPRVAEQTPSGSDVVVQPVDQTTGTTPVSVTFDSIGQAGETTVTTSAAGPSTPSAFTLGDPPVFYDITTTAAFTGPIEICIDISGVGFPAGGATRLLHYENGAWVDVTTSASSTLVCGQADSLSPFTVAQVPPIALDLSVSPAVIWPPNNKMVAVSAQISVSQPGAPSAPRVELVSVTADEPLGAGDIQQAVLGTDCRRFLVRASRLGSGRGRTYTITYRATDAEGVSTVRRATVFVPHDRGK
jgi:hypothetical protein